MDENNLPILIGLQFAVLICLILAGGLWFTFRELKKARKKSMTMRREYSKMQRQLKANESRNAKPSNAVPPLQFLQQSIDQTEASFTEKYQGSDIKDLTQQHSPEHFILALRHLIFSKERDLRADGAEKFTLVNLIKSLEPFLADYLKTSTNDDASSMPDSSGSESQHYKNLYDELLITLQRSKETIRSLALRLSEIIDDGMDEDQLNSLVEELNNSMTAFGELSGISSAEGNQQMEDEVKEIRRAYELGMDLMEHFENALKYSDQTNEAIEEHALVVENNRTSYEEGETVDREAVLTNNKRYERLLKSAKIIVADLSKEIGGGKDIIGEFLAVTRKYQDQSTRIAILQSREKQLNSDLKQVKMAKDDAHDSIRVRDIQLGALHSKFIDNNDNELVGKICTLAEQIYTTEMELEELDETDKTSATKNKRQELIQKRLGIEEQIRKLVGNS